MKLISLQFKNKDFTASHLTQDGPPVAGSCEHGNETSASITGEKFLTSGATTSFCGVSVSITLMYEYSKYKIFRFDYSPMKSVMSDSQVIYEF
jgi:hypothetical protein